MLFVTLTQKLVSSLPESKRPTVSLVITFVKKPNIKFTSCPKACVICNILSRYKINLIKIHCKIYWDLLQTFLLADVSLKILEWDMNTWAQLYQDLPSSMLKIGTWTYQHTTSLYWNLLVAAGLSSILVTENSQCTYDPWELNVLFW